MNLKTSFIAAAAVVTLAAPLHAANLATAANNPITSTLTVGSSDYYQLGSGGTPTTVDINSGGTLQIQAAQFQSIVGQNVANGTFTLNINAGGSVDGSGATGNGAGFWVGNNINTTTGIINLNGGTFNGQGFTDFILGRVNGVGIFNINSGSAIIGDTTPLFDISGGSGANGSGSGSGSWFSFGTGSTGSLAINGLDATGYATLFDAGYLRVNGVEGTDGTFAQNFNYTTGTGGYNTITLIPEPSAALLGGLGMLALLRRRRN